MLKPAEGPPIPVMRAAKLQLCLHQTILMQIKVITITILFLTIFSFTVFSQKDSIALKVKKGVWFSPTNVNRINGVNLGLQTDNLKDEPFSIHGVNLNADLLSVFISAYALVFVWKGNSLRDINDTVDISRIKGTIGGLSLSVGGIMFEYHIKGVSINGGICGATKAHGLLISGISNFTEEFMGLEISSLRNIAVRGRGLQIGLLNMCKNLKGFQLGLWNINSKRKLPIINWSF
jgi:hypothetical protein